MGNIFNPFIKRTIGTSSGGSTEDTLKNVTALPQPPQEATPDELWAVGDGKVYDYVSLLASEMGATASVTIVDDHTAVSSPESVSDDVCILPLYVDTTDAWCYFREGHPIIPTAGWVSWSQSNGISYKGIVDTVPTVGMEEGLYAVKGKEAIEGDPIEKNSVYKATTYKDVTTLYVVQDSAVENLTEFAEAVGMEIEVETLWYSEPSKIQNPIATTDTKMHIYLLLDCHLWIYDGAEWTDWGMNNFGLTHTNIVITEPPTADMTEGFYTLDSRVVDNIHFGITFTDSEISRLVELETCAIYMVSEGMTGELYTMIKDVGVPCLGYKIIKNPLEFDMSDTGYIYVSKLSNRVAFYLNDNWQECPFTVLGSNDSIPSTDGYYCYYKVLKKWESPNAEIANLDAEIALLKEKLNEGDGVKNFMNYAELTGSENGVKLSNISNKNISVIEIHPFITEIGEYAFSGCASLTSVEIGGGVTTIGDSAFYNCGSLTSVVIGDSVQTIGYGVFYNCGSLTSVEIGCNVTTIGYQAFYDCPSLTSITVRGGNGSYQSIDGNLYTKDGKRLIKYAIGKTATSFTIPDGVITIENNTFYGCPSLTSVVIPDSVTTIGTYAFGGCPSLTSVEIGDGVTSIGDSAFSGCSFTSVDIPDSVTTIGGSAFSNCNSLTSVVIPDSVQTIGYELFFSCDSLMSITIPDSVKRINSRAFAYCSSLVSITYTGTTEQWNAITKDTKWNQGTGAYTIHCTDGDIAKE